MNPGNDKYSHRPSTTHAAQSKRGLGRGLAALIPDAVAGSGGPPPLADNRRKSANSNATETLRFIDLRSISLNPRQPRKSFGREEIEDLTQSVREHGVLQPIVVRAKPSGAYELIAGERRFRAACGAGLEEIPAVVREGLDERASLALALIENIQREDLDPIEAAHAYQELLRDYGMTQTDLAQSIGRSQPQIANALRLLSLPDEIQDSLKERTITEGHAKVILGMDTPTTMNELWKRIVSSSLSVRQAEREAELLRAGKTEQPRPKAVPAPPNPQLTDIGQRLSLHIGAKVRLVPGRGDRGVIEIAYYDLEHLEGLLDRLAK